MAVAHASTGTAWTTLTADDERNAHQQRRVPAVRSGPLSAAKLGRMVNCELSLAAR